MRWPRTSTGPQTSSSSNCGKRRTPMVRMSGPPGGGTGLARGQRDRRRIAAVVHEEDDAVDAEPAALLEPAEHVVRCAAVAVRLESPAGTGEPPQAERARVVHVLA